MSDQVLSSLSSPIKRFFSGTLLSRISGMGRDLVMAFIFGDHPSVAAFMVAFRLSQILRRLFGEGPLQSAFIPHFEGLRVQNQDTAAGFFRNLSFLLVVVLIGVVLFSEGIFYVLLTYFHLSQDNCYVIQLTSLMMPSLIFICLYGINISLLQCYECFFVSSVAPFLCNVIWIAGALMLKEIEPNLAMMTLSKFILIGFIAQWLITLPLTLKHVKGSIKEWVVSKIFRIPLEVKQLIKAFAFGAIGVGASQINVFFDCVFARYADLKGPAYLWYAIRLEQLALALFGMACVGTLVPLLSRTIKAKEIVQAQKIFSLSSKRCLSVMIPCTFAILALGAASINLLYGRGQFSQMAISQTTLCLWAYTLGLIPSTQVMLFSSILYAEGNFRTSTWIALFTVGLNIALNAFFVFVLHLGTISIALATALSAWANSVILQSILLKKGWKTEDSSLRILKLISASAFACLCVIFLEGYVWDSASFKLLFIQTASYPVHFWQQVIYFSGLSICFIGAFGGYVIVSKNQDFLELFHEFFFRKKK